MRAKSPTGSLRLAKGFVDGIAGFVFWMCGRVSARIGVAVVLIALAVGLVFSLMPKTEYLPEGNRELLFGILLPPPGYNLEELQGVAKTVETDILPLMENDREKAHPKSKPFPR